MTYLSRSIIGGRAARQRAALAGVCGILLVVAVTTPTVLAQARPKAAAATTTVTVVSGASNSLCINPSGVTESATWGDGSSPPSTPSPSLTSYSNTNGCNPPSSLSSLTGPVVEAGPGQATCGYGTIGGNKKTGPSWVGIEPGCSDSDNPPPTAENDNKYYIFDAEFTMPPCYTAQSLSGSMLADNAAAAYLNNNLLAAQSTVNGGGPANFTTPTTFSTTSFFQPGTNTLDFLVEDHSTPQVGLQFSVTVSYVKTTCGGTLKICKVAGLGVSVGTPFTFNYTVGSASGSVSVPAGPAPGGYCVVVGTFPAGAYKITESIPTGDSVSSITAVPSGGTANLSAGTFSGKLKAKIVTEVTYTDQDIPQGGKPGYLEICKDVPAGPAGAPSSFTFAVDGEGVTVPTNACSPAIEVLAGATTVTETPVAGFSMTGCSAIPAINLVSCNTGSNSATVTVDAGGVSAETILTVTNEVGGSTGGGCSPGTPSLQITSANATTFNEDVAGSFTVTTCGSPTTSLAESGPLPVGVTFSDNGDGTATLAGTPATGTAGSYPLEITADNGSSVNQSFTLTVS
jgi:hypothetical protein